MRSAKPGLKAGGVAWLGVCELGGRGTEIDEDGGQTDEGEGTFEHQISPSKWCSQAGSPAGHDREIASASFNRGLSRRQRRRKIAAMLFLKQSLPAAAILASLVLAAHADPVGCEQNKVVLARVVSKDARLHFIAGKSERMPACPSAESACRLRAYAVPGDEVLVDATEAPYLCAFFKSQTGRETRGWLPRAALQIAPSEGAPARQWAGKWQRDREAQIVIASHGDEVEVSGDALWGSYDRQRVRRGAVHVGELSGKGRPRGHALAIGYDPDKSGFPSGKDQPPEDCAAKLELYGRYLVVEDNLGCGGLNVSFTGIYVRVKSLKRLDGV